ncbi:UNVERIFIED_CONTAM: hypothetical protein FKN15_015781 [Acipenser sinensis]
MVLGWKDKLLVLMLSTFHGSDCEKVQRTIKRGEIQGAGQAFSDLRLHQQDGCSGPGGSLLCQLCFYKEISEVVEEDVLLAAGSSNCEQCSLKVESGQLPVRHKTFRKDLLVQLVGNVRNPGSRKCGRPSSTDREERLNEKPHSIAKNEEKRTKDCAVCSDRKTKGGRRETVWFCRTCSRQPGLHPDDCFERLNCPLEGCPARNIARLDRHLHRMHDIQTVNPAYAALMTKAKATVDRTSTSNVTELDAAGRAGVIM